MQNSLFYDYYALIDSCSFLKKYDALFRAFDLIYDQPDFPELGRRGYRRSAYFKALIYKQSAHIKCISDLVRDLESRPILAEMCGFNAGRIPDASRFSRFLTDTNNAEIETLFHASGKLLVEKGIATLEDIMADSKPIKANTKHNNPKHFSQNWELHAIFRLASPVIKSKFVKQHALLPMQDGLRLNFQVFSTKSGLSGRLYRQTKFPQRFCRKSGSSLSPSQRFSPISHESRYYRK